MRIRSRGQCGATLIELMFTVGLSTIVVGVMTQVLFVQNKSFIDQLSYGESQQNARASLALIKRFVRGAGWAVMSDADVVGSATVGTCFNSGSSAMFQTTCDGVDRDNDGGLGSPAGMDRLRVISMQPNNGGGIFGATYASNTDGPGLIAARPVAPSEQLVHPFGLGRVAVISGPCLGGNPGARGIDLLSITGVASAVANEYTYSFNSFEPAVPTLACLGGTGYDQGFSFGLASVADFFITRDAKGRPTLRVRLDPTTPIEDAFTVSVDIDDLQIRYLLDTTCAGANCTTPTTPDNYWDVACDNINSSDVGSYGCAGTAALTTRQRIARIIGVQIGLISRTRRKDPKRDTGGNNLVLMNHTFKGKDDGYRRWIFRTTIAIRNNVL